MSITLTVEARLLGRKKPLFSDWSVALPAEMGEAPRLRAVIAEIVRAEVLAFQQRQAERRLARVLTPEQIEQGRLRGKVDSGERDLKQAVDAEAAVTTALQAFEDGLYFVFVGGEQVANLDSEVHLEADTRLSFVRLVALAGG